MAFLLAEIEMSENMTKANIKRTRKPMYEYDSSLVPEARKMISVISGADWKDSIIRILQESLHVVSDDRESSHTAWIGDRTKWNMALNAFPYICFIAVISRGKWGKRDSTQIAFEKKWRSKFEHEEKYSTEKCMGARTMSSTRHTKAKEENIMKYSAFSDSSVTSGERRTVKSWAQQTVKSIVTKTAFWYREPIAFSRGLNN